MLAREHPREDAEAQDLTANFHLQDDPQTVVGPPFRVSGDLGRASVLGLLAALAAIAWGELTMVVTVSGVGGVATAVLLAAACRAIQRSGMLGARVRRLGKSAASPVSTSAPLAPNGPANRPHSITAPATTAQPAPGCPSRRRAQRRTAGAEAPGSPACGHRRTAPVPQSDSDGLPLGITASSAPKPRVRRAGVSRENEGMPQLAAGIRGTRRRV